MSSVCSFCFKGFTFVYCVFSGLLFVHSVSKVLRLFIVFFRSFVCSFCFSALKGFSILQKKGRNDIWSREIKKEISRMFLQKQTKTVTTDGGISTELPFFITH
jgi:hypothetical protein